MEGVSPAPAYPGEVVPPSVADTGAKGASSAFARADHTHASKARKVRVESGADGKITWVFDPPFADGVIPRVVAIAEAGGADVINVQLTEPPTNLQCKLLVNRTQRSVVALLGLTILSLPAQPGITWVHAVALEP